VTHGSFLVGTMGGRGGQSAAVDTTIARGYHEECGRCCRVPHRQRPIWGCSLGRVIQSIINVTRVGIIAF
jgi:hypothetical protein